MDTVRCRSGRDREGETVQEGHSHRGPGQETAGGTLLDLQPLPNPVGRLKSRMHLHKQGAMSHNYRGHARMDRGAEEAKAPSETMTPGVGASQTLCPGFLQPRLQSKQDSQVENQKEEAPVSAAGMLGIQDSVTVGRDPEHPRQQVLTSASSASWATSFEMDPEISWNGQRKQGFPQNALSRREAAMSEQQRLGN